MSITLMAYPMAFLISPEEAKNEKLRNASDNDIVTNVDTSRKLRSIRVLSNITYNEIEILLKKSLDCTKRGSYYQLEDGLCFSLARNGKYIMFNLFGCADAVSLQAKGENLFSALDSATGRNVRLIDSSEFFYFNYETSFTEIKDIYNNLKAEKAEQIFPTADNGVVATLNGENIRYYKQNNDETYTLEVEQIVKILNIGLSGKSDGRNITYGLTDLKIRTNIKASELKQFLKQANYLFYEADHQTPLKNSDATLNWVLKDGYYTAEFSGSNNAAITKEAEIIFRKLNIAAGRDLRLINDVFTTVYTYNTNYTDKGMLLNTLVEHGAEEITESADEITCKLFGMEMVYHKKDSSSAFVLDVTQVSNKSECEDLISDLNEEYGLNIQEMTYNKIKERLEQENMRLESEAVMDDNSIVLTIEV